MDLKKKKLIIFDLDGTLVDSQTDILIANNLTLQKFGYKTISYQQGKKYYWPGNYGQYYKIISYAKSKSQ
tara:strand:+ start:1014 stop:1223 length:210 start_codon:yes stop_codon:yes gene_type:complete